MWFHKYNYVKDKGLSLDQTRKVDDAGYKPAWKRIESMLKAGTLLESQRRLIYDFESVTGEEEVPLHRQQGVDVFDLIERRRYLISKMKASQTSFFKKKAMEQPKPESAQPEPK